MQHLPVYVFKTYATFTGIRN